MELKEVHNVYMLGIGGIGMSALARFLARNGKAVAGYDRVATPLTRALEEEGIAVGYEVDANALAGKDLLIYTPAIPKNNPVLIKAQGNGISVYKRAEALGLITKTYKAVAIAGTHGKTTTSGMVTHFLRNCGVSATGFVGGILKNYQSNFVPGNSDWVVVEADEFDRSFLNLRPNLAVITSVDPDHLDIYGESGRMEQAYAEFTTCLEEGGKLFLNHRLSEFAKNLNRESRFYGIEAGDYRAENLTHTGLGIKFDYQSPSVTLKGMQLNFPGHYNVENAVAAITVALEAGADADSMANAVAGFSGINRRFDIRYQSESVVHIDDYAHHPEEIKALLSSVRKLLPEHEMIVAFQPHLYTRTRDFAEGFAESLSLADKVAVLDIYPARELPIEGVTSALIYDRLKVKETALTDLSGVVEIFRSWKNKPAVVLTVGAGSIDTKVDEVEQEVSTW